MRISGVWLSTPPGTQVAYSNLGYVISATAVLEGANAGAHRLIAARGEKPSQAHLAVEVQGAAGVLLAEHLATRLAGGLWSSPKDLSHYVRMLFARGLYKDRQVLGSQSIDEMFSQQNTGNALELRTSRRCSLGRPDWWLSRRRRVMSRSAAAWSE